MISIIAVNFEAFYSIKRIDKVKVLIGILCAEFFAMFIGLSLNVKVYFSIAKESYKLKKLDQECVSEVEVSERSNSTENLIGNSSRLSESIADQKEWLEYLVLRK